MKFKDCYSQKCKGKDDIITNSTFDDTMTTMKEYSNRARRLIIERYAVYMLDYEEPWENIKVYKCNFTCQQCLLIR